MLGLVVAIELITLHMVDGRTVAINPLQVQQVIHPHERGNRLVVPSVKCIVRLVNGYVSVIETCEEVQQLLEGGRP